MNFKNYQRLSKRTCASLGSIKLDLSHMVMGMSSEIPEVLDAHYDKVNLSEELADIMWYVSNYCTFRNIVLDQFERVIQEATTSVSITEDYLSLTHQIGTLNDIVKKKVAYDKQINATLENKALMKIVELLGRIFISYDLKYEVALENNIDKLKARYPSNFTTENANVRDLKTERKILEKNV